MFSISNLQDNQDFNSLIKKLDDVLERNTKLAHTVTSDLVDIEFLNEIKTTAGNGNISVYFGKTLKDLKIVLPDDNGFREHEIYLQYSAPKKLRILNVNLPRSSSEDREYSCLGDVLETCRQDINDLAPYFEELEHIDQACTVMEPINATFKDDYRRILLDDRTWLHLEVTAEGMATNIHLVGQSQYWHNKLQTGLLVWDHGKRIVENVMTIFDLSSFPQSTTVSQTKIDQDNNTDCELVCGICLCVEISDAPGLPQPLCQNTTCGVYYHRTCLYQWLVACAGSRLPAFGVANGACPTCLQPITCSEKDT